MATEEERAYCVANFSRFVRPSIDQMVSDHYLDNFLSLSFHTPHADWSW